MAITLGLLCLFALGTGSLAQWPLGQKQPPLHPTGGEFLQPFPGAPMPPPPPPPTLSRDLDEITRLIQFKPLNQLLVRYLINDSQFQAFVRIINSNAGFTARWRLLSQPELILFLQWVDQQLLASGGAFEMEEQELAVTLFNRFPYWSGTVFGWQGFLNEAQLYFPTYAIRAHIDAKLLQPGIFSQFWSRLQALRVVYERWLALPGTAQVVAELQQAGIDTAQLDGIIRDLFGWNIVVSAPTTAATTVTAATSTPAPPTSSPAAVIPPGNGAPVHPLPVA
ncbi:uncharacterized protein LOC117894669 [Drosophila subobscura]|uniref:uncharacterized protein LOC117894669 n=1 Tax=Drosophila subobscura TaxID=7241 RepID=UPI00155B3505|nr:uncharacterized protein LOC117894669 [Drosophila subobscura]